MASLADIVTFVNTQMLGVISTINSAGQPESAVVGIGQTDKLQIIFGTSGDSRKARNIRVNPRVAVVIGWDEDAPRTVQLQGTARELGGDETNHYAELYYTKAPAARKYHSRPDQCYFLVEPTWVRYSDFTADTDDVTELNF